MKPRALAVLTLLNLALLVVQLVRATPAGARGDDGVLRGRALEIVDERGRVRASIRVHPASTTPDGKAYPDTTMLRLVDPNGRPEVKLGASVEGAGLGLVGATDATQALLGAQGSETSLRLRNREGEERMIAP